MRLKNIAIGILTLVILVPLAVFSFDLFEEEKTLLRDFPPVENPHILVLGFVDDKDDTTTGPLKRINVPDSGAVDGLSEIKANPLSDCAVLDGKVILKPGPLAENAAVALLEIKAICPFELEDQHTVGYMIDHDIGIEAEKAASSYEVEIKILNKDKKVVQGSRHKESYSFSSGDAKKIHVNLNNQKTEHIDSGEDFYTENISAKPFDLSPGSYLMTFQAQITAQARKEMNLSARSTIDFFDGKENP